MEEMKRAETVDIVKDLVKSMSFTMDITLINDNGDGTYTLYACNTYHLQECFKVLYEGANWIVTNVDKNTSITIKPVLDSTPAPTALELDIYDPYYFHGTVIQTNLELEQISNSNLKTPMIYLLEVLEDTFFNRDEKIERESDLRLFFLTQANFTDWKTQDSYANAIEPMRSLCYSFIDTLNSSKIISNFAQYRIINHTKFGVYMTDKGYEKRIFNDNLAGVELRISLPINRVNDCKEFC
jgi:hypothetical protein